MQTQPATTPATDDRFAEIQQRAYLLWEKAQCPDGNDLTFWLLAEAELNGNLHDKADGPQAVPQAIPAIVRRNDGSPTPARLQSSAPRSGAKARTGVRQPVAAMTRAARAS